MTVCYVWGWDDVAGLLAICWGGLARVGVLPADVGLEALAGVQQVFLSVLEAKTRFNAARRKCLKIDQPQLVESMSRSSSLLEDSAQKPCFGLARARP